MKNFTDILRSQAASIWEAELKHPFVLGIADGSLPKEKFKYYLCQDYLFLLDYSKVFAYGVVKSSDEATMAKFAQLLNETLNTEMDLHRGYSEKFGISPAEMEATPMAPTTHAYTRHLLPRCTGRHAHGTRRRRVAVSVGLLGGRHQFGRTR